MKDETLSLLGTTALKIDVVKQTLLDKYDFFIDNEFLDKYLNHVFLNMISLSDKNYVKHHFIPVCYYKNKFSLKNRRDAEKYANRDDNNLLIRLSFEDHILAHYYLCFCTRDILHRQMIFAFERLIMWACKYMDFDVTSNLTQYGKLNDEYIKCLKEMNSKPLCESARKKLSEYWKGRKRGVWSEERRLDASIRIKDEYKTGKRVHCHKACSEITKKKISVAKIGKRNESACRKVICIETQQIFDSTVDAAKFVGIKQSTMVTCCKHYKYHQSKGYHFAYLDDNCTIKELSKYIGKERYSDKRAKNNISSQLKKRHKEGLMPENVNKKKVICLTTNKIFDSLAEASKHGNVSVGSLCWHLKGHNKTCGKLSDGTRLCWRYYYEG